MKAKKFLSLLLVTFMFFGSIGSYATEMIPDIDDISEMFLTSEETGEEESDVLTEAKSGTIASGKIKWELTTEGMLILSGSGEIDDFADNEAPWSSYAKFVTFVYISDNITKIGSYAFANLYNVSSVYIPDTVTIIKNNAFEGCQTIAEFMLPDSVEIIEEYAFASCSSIETITIPAFAEEVDPLAFSNCFSLAEIYVAERNENYVSQDGILFDSTLTKLISYPDGKGETSYYIPDGVEVIGRYAFDNCTYLKEIEISGTVERIESGAFFECSSVEALFIPASVKSIAQDAILYGMPSLKSIEVDEENEEYSSEGGMLYTKDKTRLIRVPSNIEFYMAECILSRSLKVIGQEAFYGCEADIAAIIIYGSLQKIEMAAFMNCAPVECIQFDGTELGWSLVKIESHNEALDDAEMFFMEGEIVGEELQLIAGRTYYLEDHIDVEEYKDILATMIVTSSDTSVAAVDSKKLIAVAPGTALITAVGLKDGETPLAASVRVKVVEGSGTSETGAFILTVGEIRSLLTDLIIPDEYKDGLSWATLNPKIATVENGVVTAIAPGETKVVASLISGSGKEFSVSCDITVNAKYTDEKYFEFSNGKITKYTGPDTVVDIPDKIKGTVVTTIDSFAFADCSHVTKVVMPETITKINTSAFYNCTSLANITLHEGITYIGNYAFENCNSLVKITIPSTVTNESINVFRGCKKLTTVIFAEGTVKIGKILSNLSTLKNVTIPSTVKTIGDNAFYNCSVLTSVLIPNSVTKVGYAAFRNCYNLTSATIGDKVTDLGSYAFSNCQKLTTVKIGKAIKLIKDYTFYGCTKLNTVTIPDSVTSVGKYAFAECSKLTEAKIGKNVSAIGAYAFYHCTSLSKVNIPSNVKVIYEYTFENTALKTISIPTSVVSIGKYAFYDCAQLTTVTLNEGLRTINEYAFGYSGVKSITIPDSVTDIKNDAFFRCYSLENVEIGSGVTAIKSYTFYYCIKLKNIVLGPNVKTIESYALTSTAIESLVIPDSVTTVGINAFSNCSSLREVTIGKGIKTITNGLFVGCNNITSVVLSEGITSIGDNAFRGCLKLKSISIPGTVRAIGKYAFYGCTALENVQLLEGVTKINDYAFYNCQKLPTIEIPDSVTYLGHYVFCNCYSLKSVKLSGNIKTIGESAFYYCDSLTGIVIPESVENILGYAFAYCKSLKQIEIPGSVARIYSSAFNSCSSLSKVTFNEGLKYIESYAFRYCTALEEITLPDSLKAIYDYAFSYCTKLKNVNFGEGLENVFSGVFTGCKNLVFTGSIPSVLAKYIINNNLFGNGDLNIIHRYFNSSKTSYRATNESMLGYIPLELSYELKSTVSAKNMKIDIVLPFTAEYMTGTMKVNGKLSDNVTITENSTDYTVSVPVTERSGDLTFCIKPTAYQNIATYAEMRMYVSNSSKTEFIGYVNCSVPEISISAPDIVKTSTVVVEGLTLPKTNVKLYVDGVYQGSTMSYSSGKYRSTVDLPSQGDFNTYMVKAEIIRDSEVFYAEKEIQLNSEAPELSGFKMWYEKGEEYRTRRNKEIYDLYNSSASPKVQWGDYFTGNNYIRGTSKGYQYKFRVSIDGRESVDKVYVVSTRNGVKSYLEAKWNKDKEYYETNGFFNNEPLYMPGTLTIEYIQKGTTKLYELTHNKKALDIKDGDFKSNIFGYTSESFNAVVDISEELKNEFGGKLKLKIRTNKSVEQTVSSNEEKHNYYTYSYNKNDENFKLTFDLTDATQPMLYYYDENDGSELIYEIGFFDMNEDGYEDGYDVEEILEKLNSRYSKIFKLYNINVDTGALSEQMIQFFDDKADIEEGYKKIEGIKNKKDMFLLSVVALCASSYETITGPTTILDAILKSIDDEMEFFRNNRLVDLVEIGKSFKVSWKIDPSGYVFEGVTDNRLKDVTATINCIPVEEVDTDGDGTVSDAEANAISDGAGSPWLATEYEQLNPLLTDENGDYRWDVPEGFYWQVKYEKDGYVTAYSKWMPVPPVQTDVNIGLVSNAQPKVESVYLATEYLTITFDKYMDPETLTDIEIGGRSYTIDYDKTKTDLNGKVFAKEYTVKFDEPLVAGTYYDLKIEGAKSYADVMAEKYDETIMSDGEARPQELIVEEITDENGVVTVVYNNNTGKTISFTTVCTGYDKDGKVTDVKIKGTYGLATGFEETKDFELSGNYETYKVFTWSEDDSLAPVIEAK